MSSKTEDNKLPKEKEPIQTREKDDKADPINVHSANDWESVDLGGDERKKKFLRLMGAGKKDHHGKIIIGDHEAVHARSRGETEHVDDVLEEQFKQGLEHKMASGFKGHLGLGFHKDEKKEGEEKKEESEVDKKEDKAEHDNLPEKPRQESEGSDNSKEVAQKHKQDNDEEEGESVKKKMKMNFVKASS